MNKITRPAPLPKPIKQRLWATLPNGREVSCKTIKNYRYLVASTHEDIKLGVKWYEDFAKAEKRAKYYNNKGGYPASFVVVPVTREEEES